MRSITAQSAPRRPASSVIRAGKRAEQLSRSSQAAVREVRTCSALPGPCLCFSWALVAEATTLSHIPELKCPMLLLSPLPGMHFPPSSPGKCSLP